MPTLLCVPILVADIPSALDAAARAKAAGADLVEFRIDDVFAGATGRAGEDDVRSIVSLVSRSVLPCIVTCRLASEAGTVGGYDGDEQARVSLFEHLGTLTSPNHPPRYLDVELAAYTRSENFKQKVNLAVDHAAQNRDLSTSLILSAHDFDGRPADLTRRVAAMHGQPAAAVHKIAYRARSLRDNLELLDLALDNTTPTIALGIGEFGLMSRVLAPKFNAFLTFASLDRASTTAPGQPTVDDLLNLYRFRSITRSTRVYGVVGWPVEHSKSPHIHNAGFAEIGYDGVYLPLPIPPEYEHFKATILALLDHERLDFSGCSVTIPHKEHLVRLAREQGWELDQLSTLCGAANTLIVTRKPASPPMACLVINTDGAGASCVLDAAQEEIEFSSKDPGGEEVWDETLQDFVPQGFQMFNRCGSVIAVIGAGGAARALAAALVMSGCVVDVYNRGITKAEALVRDLSENIRSAGLPVHGVIAAHDLASFPARPVTAVVNCTPVGMAGGPAPSSSPVPDDALARSGAKVVMDTVYTPRNTPLLAAAQQLNIRTVDGVEMFLAQASGQFTAWTAVPGPRAMWKQLVDARLK